MISSKLDPQLRIPPRFHLPLPGTFGHPFQDHFRLRVCAAPFVSLEMTIIKHASSPLAGVSSRDEEDPLLKENEVRIRLQCCVDGD